jgi:hypothetical protein
MSLKLMVGIRGKDGKNRPLRGREKTKGKEENRQRTKKGCARLSLCPQPGISVPDEKGTREREQPLKKES